MKVIYSKEKNFTDKICAVVGILNILFIPADLLFNKANLVSVYYFFLFVAVFMGVGVWITRKEMKSIRAEREFIVSNGYECRGEVIGYNRRRRKDKRYTSLRVKYHSRILDRDITFDTPDLHIPIEENEGVYCTVYETPATEQKVRRIEKIRSAFGVSGNFEGSDPDFEPEELSYIADTLENAEIKKTKPAEVLYTAIILLIFAALCIWALKDSGVIK